MNLPKSSIDAVIIGSGAWGRALAFTLSRNDKKVLVQFRNKKTSKKYQNMNIQDNCFCVASNLLAVRYLVAAAIPPTLVSNLLCFCNLLRKQPNKILPKSWPDPPKSLKILPKSFQDRFHTPPRILWALL